MSDERPTYYIYMVPGRLLGNGSESVTLSPRWWQRIWHWLLIKIRVKHFFASQTPPNEMKGDFVFVGSLQMPVVQEGSSMSCAPTNHHHPLPKED